MLEEERSQDHHAAGVSRRGLFLGGVGIGGGALLSALAAPTASAAGRADSADAGGSALPWPPRGCFGSKVVVGAQQPSARAMIDATPVLGLPREATFFYGNLRDAEGNMYEIVRGMSDRPGGNSVMFIQGNAGMDTLHALPGPMAAAASSLGFSAALVVDSAVWRSAPTAAGKPFEITMTADGSRTTWKEAGLLELGGDLLGPGLQWYLPDAEGSELYVSQIYQMQGTLMGKPVRGILALDQSYLPEGQLMYSGKDPLFRPRSHHRCWYTWGTRYKDGSYDAGHFVLGTDRMGFALLTNERRALTLDTDVSGDIQLVPQGVWPQHIVIKAGGVEWEFLPEPRGRMPDMLGGKVQAITPQNEGRWRRVGDRREPDVWFAWGEIASRDRINYSRAHRT